ncbi:multiple sugar transport system permease protein/sn-glycerol 3-phosphate transport system permease protein [Kribbella steppae]|uniref:Multiple sugar transport system permease protein/sn-glycerol 3-phosphate transport system permease protein n=1 Tax=Kribbella steppae TaxID=2512223 RepID=A0A4R2GUI1_9ACTN|nr:sugar ABC transporter permease [Kribbella steppae]TCO13518.1 multiple sugar transport system permease protein/sn-glycerol 3-phosphate transport system permease protein [Kribbella steppae]
MAVAIAAGQRAQEKTSAQRRDWLPGYLFISPAVLLFLVFVAAPLVAAFGLSLFHWDLLSTPEFAGLDNFRQLVTDGDTIQAVVNTLVFATASVITHIGFGMLLALGVHRTMTRGTKYFVRTAYFFPFLVSWAAVALIWKYVLDPTFGLATHYLSSIGLPTTNWLASPTWALPTLIVVDWWHTIGYTFIILLAGLQTVPAQLHEAARVDGANAWWRFWSVTLPVMSPTIFFATVITFIGAFQIFDPMLIMTNGGPDGATRSIVMYTYEKGFQSFEVGYAAALSLVLFVVIIIATGVQFRLSRRWVHQ